MIWSFGTIQTLGALTHYQLWNLVIWDRAFTTYLLIALLNTSTTMVCPQNWWDN